MEIAGLKHISATANMFNVLSAQEENYEFSPTVLSAEKDTDRKQYIPLFINKFRIIALVDSGCDITLIQEGLLNKILPTKSRWYTKQKEIKLISASGNSIETYGRLYMDIYFKLNLPPLQLTVTVVPTNKNVPAFIFGADALVEADVSLKFGANPPRFITGKPCKYESPVYWYSPMQQECCVGHYFLEPLETKTIRFLLCKAAPVVRTDYILITSHEWQEVQILPSRSPIEFDYKEECFTSYGCIVNLSSTKKSGLIWGRYEVLKNKRAIPLKEGRLDMIRNCLKTHPLGREILPCSIQSEVPVPILTINKISIQQDKFDEPDVRILDFTPENAIMKGEPTYTGTVEITPDFIDPKGLELPTQVFANAAEAIDLSSYNEEIRPFIKELFIDKYPEVVALHAIDAGDLSLTLGLTQIRLKPGEVLPKCKRLFHISPTDMRHLDDICGLLIKFGYLIKAPITPDGNHLYGMASYLVTRAKPGTLGRLIVDYSPINSLIQSPPNIIPDISATLQFLSGKALYTSLDLKQAYLSLKVDEASRALSTFLTPTAAYQWTSVPTGMASSPAYWAEVSQRMIHSEPVLDDNGKPIYECKNVVKMVPSPLKWVRHYFDDILSTSPLKNTFHETLVEHFRILEQLINRLAFHGSKISINKSEFAKAKIVYLGWYICNNYVIADPRRIQKIRDFAFPETKKGMRSFLGVINSLRRVIYLDILEDAQLLTPLTSSSKPYAPTNEQRRIFEKIKLAMVSGPLFNNLIDESAEKYLWVDASTSSNVVGAVLAQKRRGVPNQKIVPPCLDMDDPIHRMIFDRELSYEPVPVHTKLPICLPKPSPERTIPPKISIPQKFIAFTEENVHDSLFLGTASILAVYGCKPHNSTIELRKLAVKELKKDVGALKLRNFVFNNNYNDYRNYLDEFCKGLHNVDKHLYLVEALAKALMRPIIILSRLPEHKENPILKFNYDIDKPPLIFGVLQVEDQLVFLPFMHNRNVTFCLDDHFQRIEIIGYMAKSIPEVIQSRGILDVELVAILTGLTNFEKYISNVPVTLLTDSKCLYYLFNQRIQNSCVKMRRWCYKLVGDFSNVKIRYVKTSENLSDFLTREGLPPGDVEKLNLKAAKILDFVDHLPKEEFTLTEWAQYCADNPQYLTIVDTKTATNLMLNYDKSLIGSMSDEEAFIKHIALSIQQGLQNVEDITKPLDIIKQRLSRSEIIKNQKKEFEQIYTACLGGDDFEYIDENSPNKTKYKLVNDLLMIYNDFYKIYLPTCMIGLLLSFTHLLGHKGITRMMCDMESYYFDKKYTITKRFIRSCYACFLSHKSSRKNKLGVYPLPNRAMQEVSVDLAENLNKVNGYSHLLIVRCALSGFTLVLPLASKSSTEVNRTFKNCVLLQYTVERLHSDNAKCFRSREWLKLLSAWGITVINTSSINPSARGMAECEVNLVKLMMKKYLATASHDTYNWDMLTYICTKVINYSVNPISGIMPAQMIYGKEDNGPSFLQSNEMAPPHYSVKSDKLTIEKITQEVQAMTEYARDKITQARIVAHERVNKNRITNDWAPGDVVFVLDRAQIPGNTRPLKTRFCSSPCVIVRCLFNTSLVRRLSDNFVSLYSNNDLKRYDGADPLFNTLPKEISKILLHKFQEFLSYDFTEIAKHDPFEIPNGIQLFDPVEDEKDQENKNKEEDTDTKNDQQVRPIISF